MKGLGNNEATLAQQAIPLETLAYDVYKLMLNSPDFIERGNKIPNDLVDFLYLQCPTLVADDLKPEPTDA